jgi:cytochrome bd-type quinol oxidase subunit 2
MKIVLLTLDWWTKRRNLLGALVLYIVILLIGSLLAGTIGAALSDNVTDLQRAYIGPWLNLFLAVASTLLVSQRKGHRERFLFALVAALVGLLGKGALLTAIIPALVSMTPNER